MGAILEKGVLAMKSYSLHYTLFDIEVVTVNAILLSFVQAKGSHRK